MLEICEAPNDFSLPNFLDGSTVSLSAYDGRVILLSFICIRCGWCMAWMQHMQQLQDDYETNPNVQILGVIYNYNDGSDGMGHSGPVDAAWITEKLGDYGLTVTFPLLMDGPYAGSVAQQYLAGFSGAVGFPYSYLISRNFIIANKWHRLSTSNGEPICFDSGDLNDTEYFVRHRLDDLQKTRNAWDTVLVLDYSGSMYSSVTIEGVTKPKIEFLQEAAGTLLKVWKDYALCDDRIGLVYFQDHATTDGMLLPIYPEDNISTLITNIAAKSADGCTAMGAGIATGLDILESSPNRRFIILFSDGMQNRNPLVYVAAISHNGAVCFERQIDNIGPADYPDPLTTLCGGNAGQSNYAGTLPVVLELIDVPIHTIGIGAPAAWQTMLQAISLASLGQFNMDMDIWPNLKEFFLENLVEIYRGSSLQMVTKKRATLAQESGSESFLLNRSAKKMTVLLSWVSEERPLTFSLRKAGHTVRLDNKVTDEGTYRFATLTFPHYQKPWHPVRPISTLQPTIASRAVAKPGKAQVAWQMQSELVDAEGNWEVVIERMFPEDQSPVPYHLVVLADDSCLEYVVEIPREIMFTGDHLPISVRVLEGGKPVENIYSAEAIIRRPTESLGNILASLKEKKSSATKTKVESGDTAPGALAAMVEEALQNKDVVAALKKFESDRLRLAPQWKERVEKRPMARGLLRSFYKETTRPGYYRVDLTIRGASKRCGVFERAKTHTILVQPKPDKSSTEINGNFNSKKGVMHVQLTPTDRYGNKLGIGYSKSIDIEIDGQKMQPINDHLDGSYGIDVEVPAKKRLEDLTAKISACGFTMFEGPLNLLVKGGPTRN
jgi:hypothetical protein